MKENFSVNLDTIKLEQYQKTLENAKLLPGRLMLREKLKENFQMLRNAGIQNIGELMKLLKNVNKLKELSMKTQINEEYLVLLRREIGSLVVKPLDLKKLPCIEKSIHEKFYGENITTTKDLLGRTLTKFSRQALAEKIKLPYNELLKLCKIADLTRVNGVGPVFAQMLYDVKCDTVSKLKTGSEEELFQKLMKVNTNHKYTKSKFSVGDVGYCITFAKLIPDFADFE